MAMPVKYITEEQKQEAHRKAQKRYVERKKNGTPRINKQKRGTPTVTDGDAPWPQREES